MVARPSLAASALACTLMGCFNPPLTDDTTATSGPTLVDTTSTSSTSNGPDTPTSTSPDPSTTTTATPSTSSTSEPTTTSSAGMCPLCAAPTPTCLPSGTCGTCEQLPDEDSDCAALDPALPHCDPASGACIACLTATDCLDSVYGPYCDADAGLCGCREHTDCPETACDLGVGQCFQPALTDHAYVEAVPCSDAPCTADAPCCDIAVGITATLKSGKTHHIVHVGPGIYVQPVRLVDADHRVAILAEPGAIVSSQSPDGHALVLGDVGDVAQTTAALFVAGLTITGTNTLGGATCWYSSAGLWLDDVDFIDHLGGPALFTRACTLTARRTLVQRAATAARADGGGALVLRNVVISGPGVGSTLAVAEAGHLDILYSTITNRNGLDDTLLVCDADTTVQIRNSLILSSPADAVTACLGTREITHSGLSDLLLADSSVTNKFIPVAAVPGLFTAWNTEILDLAGDATTLIDVALWQLGDPPTDLHGAPRPTMPGPDFPGADLPAP